MAAFYFVFLYPSSPTLHHTAPHCLMNKFQNWYGSMLNSIGGYESYEQHDKYALFQETLALDLQDGLPLLQVKPTPWKLAIAELLWFMSDSTSVADLEAAGVKWWRPWFSDATELTVTQLPYKRHAAGYKRVAEALLAKDYDSTRLFVNLWPHGEDLSLAVLPPCALSYQVLVRGNEYLDMTVTQRSADLICGVPSNAIQYAFLMHLYCAMTGLTPGNLQMNFGNLHVYKSHTAQPEWQELLTRCEDSSDASLHNNSYKFTGLRVIAKLNKLYVPQALDAKLLTLPHYEHQGQLRFPVVTTPGKHKG